MRVVSPKLKTTEEAAEYLRLGKSTLDKKRMSGGGPRYVRIGNCVAYDEVDLEKYVENHKQNSTAENSKPRAAGGVA